LADPASLAIDRRQAVAKMPRVLEASLQVEVEKAAWSSPAQVRATFRSADFLAANRMVFDIKGNSYRLVAQVKYAPLFLVFVHFLGTHAEYDRIDANKV